MNISQNEPSQQSFKAIKNPLQLTNSYKQSESQIKLTTDLSVIIEGAFKDLYLGAMELFSGSETDLSQFQQQSLYVATSVMGCVTQDYLNLFCNHWFICVGESGSRKTIANQIIKNTIIRTKNKCYPINMPASREGLYSRLGVEGGIPKPNVFIEFDEGLNKLYKLWANQKPESNSALNGLMSTLIESYGPVQELSEITNKDLTKSSKAVLSPRIALTLNGQGLSFAKAVTSDSFLNNGFYHRCLVFDFVVKETDDSQDNYLNEDYDSDLLINNKYLDYLNWLIKHEGNLPSKPCIKYRIKGASPRSDYDFKQDYYELLEYLNSNCPPVHTLAIVDQHNSRMKERIKTLAWLHAWGRGAEKWDTIDVTFAYMLGGLHYQNILNRLKNAPLDARNDYHLMKYIYGHVARKKTVLRQRIQSACGNHNDYKQFSSTQVSYAIKELIAEGYIVARKQGKSTYYDIGAEKFHDPLYK